MVKTLTRGLKKKVKKGTLLNIMENNRNTVLGNDFTYSNALGSTFWMSL